MSEGSKKWINSIDVDIGGTFTDCFVVFEGKIAFAKAYTTPYNLSIGFMRAIEDVAKKLKISVTELLNKTDIIRYSTTIAMNRLIERKGPRLGLITTEGFEDMILIGKGSQWQDGLKVREKIALPLVSKPEPLIPRKLIVGVRERIDCFGNVVVPLDEEDVRNKVRYLVNQGVRGIVVSLLWSFLNPVHELRVREIIYEEYPEFYAGNVSVVLSHEVLPKIGEYPRTMAAILNAYLHRSMREELTSLYNELRRRGYKRPLRIVHNTGGIGDLFTTTAIRTYNCGPIAGLIGSLYVAKEFYGLENVIATDMGGTSFDIGLLIAGKVPVYTWEPVIDRWLVGLSYLESKSIGAGGGSIAWIHPAYKTLHVGPQSAGSFPGPACYDRGGEEPTVTDADLVLGYLNPEYYFGGRTKLNMEKARKVIEEKLAKPLGVDVTEAAYMIKRVVDGNMGGAIVRETALRGYDPKEFVLFAYGGAGPTHVCGYMEYVKPKRSIVFTFSPVFCAFGSSVLDFVHFYERSIRLYVREPGIEHKFVLETEKFNEVVMDLQENALKELKAEGIDIEVYPPIFSLELDMRFAQQIHVVRIPSPRILIKNHDDVKAVYEAFIQQYAIQHGALAVDPYGGVVIEGMLLKAIVPLPKIRLPTYPKGNKDPSPRAYKGKRPAYFEELGGFYNTPCFQWDFLESGNRIEGPAIIEGEYSTLILPPGRTLNVDEYLNIVIE
ncbi:MAG: hydantoinase/oxoprolinase family protein [Candidatus Bathyarchaeia archaeon]